MEKITVLAIGYYFCLSNFFNLYLLFREIKSSIFFWGKYVLRVILKEKDFCLCNVHLNMTNQLQI